MNFLLTYIYTTILRFFPIPAKTGLISLGQPDSNSPVFLTGNFRLSIALVKRALKGTNAYILVANSAGINIWCAAAGGHLNNHRIISVIKTSGINEVVEHRRVILPLLAATGVESRVIRDKTGWSVVWGPVEASDIPTFLKKNRLTKEMGTTSFPLGRRMEMAIAWIFPVALIATLITIFISFEILIIVNFIIIAQALLIYLANPLYMGWLASSPKKGTMNPRMILLQVAVFGISALVLMLSSTQYMVPMLVVSLVMTIILTIDLGGSTPVYKSNLHHQFEITLDQDLCQGDGVCEVVCPRNCFEIRDNLAYIPRIEHCIQCGACIVQCPFDALYFTSGSATISPETIRKTKLNMMGERAVEIK